MPPASFPRPISFWRSSRAPCNPGTISTRSPSQATANRPSTRTSREIARGVSELVERHRPTLRIVLLSNSTTLARSEVRHALEFIDLPVFKLDAGTPATFRAINRPARGVRFDAVVDELTLLDGLILQTLLLDGSPSNSTPTELDAYLKLIAWIAPSEVQLYSTDRPVAKSTVGRVPPSRLRDIAREGMERTGITFRVFAA